MIPPLCFSGSPGLLVRQAAQPPPCLLFALFPLAACRGPKPRATKRGMTRVMPQSGYRQAPCIGHDKVTPVRACFVRGYPIQGIGGSRLGPFCVHAVAFRPASKMPRLLRSRIVISCFCLYLPRRAGVGMGSNRRLRAGNRLCQEYICKNRANQRYWHDITFSYENT